MVFNGNSDFVGIFTHRGERNDGFHPAFGHNIQPWNAPPPQPTVGVGPSGAGGSWIYGAMGGSSGNLPFKRDLSPPETRWFCMNDDWDKYAEPRVLSDNAKEFCKRAPFRARPQDGIRDNFYATYNAGTDDEVELTVRVPSGKELSEATCVKSFQRLLDECNYNGGNPMNWKHGGNLDYGVFRFDITTRHKRRMPQWPVLDGKCQSKYKIVLASFEVWGGGWASSGSTGKDALHREIRGCGAVKRDEFRDFTEPNRDKATEPGEIENDHWEWRYHGTLPIGTRRCLGRAMKSAGGPDKRCDGTG